MTRLTLPTFAAVVLGLAVASPLAIGQDDAGEDGADAPAIRAEDDASAEAGPAGADDPDAAARRVMDQLLQQRREVPVVEPIRAPAVVAEPSRLGAPAATVDLDPAVLGVAPGGEQPTLLPEGTFVVNRRGRLVRSTDGAHVLFVFEADAAGSPETPMILQRCRKLQDMEDYVEKHGDQAVFRLSGQVQTYRGANYLLPTMMVIDIDRGNLDP